MKPSLPHYRHWNQVPDDLLSRAQLLKEGLQPGGAPAATISHGARRGQRVELFPRSEAVPRRRSSSRELDIALVAQHREQATEMGVLDTQIQEWRQSSLKALLDLSRLEPERWVTLDTETTELIGEAISISVVSGTGEVLFDQLLHPTTPITPEAQRVHGISLEELQDQPSFLEVYPRLKQVLQGRTVLAYNADFDRSTLIRTQKRHGISSRDLHFPERCWHCLMLDSAALFGRPRSREGQLRDFRAPTLEQARQEAARALGRTVPSFQTHHSREDALATRELALLLFELARQENP